MFDLRYHVASLAAVFIALAVGIVIGVAIASGGGVNKATKQIQEGKINELSQQLAAAQADVKTSHEQEKAIEDLMQEAYPTLMEGRLANKKVAVLFLGPVDDDVNRAVDQTLTDAGPVPTASDTAVKLPIDMSRIDALLGGDATLTAFSGESNLRALGKALAGELVAGGEAPLWNSLDSTLVEQRTGAILDPVDGVVIVRSWLPPANPDAQEQQRDTQSEELIKGILDGLRGTDVAAVGVSGTPQQGATADPLAVFRDLGLSTVNDVDQLPGRVALALLLGGGEPGDYGVGDGATAGVSPPIEPVPATTGAP